MTQQSQPLPTPGFHIGGSHDDTLDELGRAQQLQWYFSEHFPQPEEPQPGENTSEFDRWLAELPDRLTHSAMLVLGSAAGHRMPQVLYTRNVQQFDTDCSQLALYGLPTQQDSSRPAHTHGPWIIAVHGGGLVAGGGPALEMLHRPNVAALAELTSYPALDVDYPLLAGEVSQEQYAAECADAIAAACDYAKQQGATKLLGYSVEAGAAILSSAAEHFDALVFDAPRFSCLADYYQHQTHPIDTARWPKSVLLQTGALDTRSDIPVEVMLASSVTHYPCDRWIIEPATACQKLFDAARFFAGRPLVDPREELEETIRKASSNQQP